MKLAVLGDIHANSTALEKVLNDIDQEKVDKIVHTGDVVGYGTDIGDCIRTLVNEGIEGVQGNHDLMALGEMGTDDCIRPGIKAIHWTWEHISDEERTYLANLPSNLILGKIALFHATPNSVLTRVTKSEHVKKVMQELNILYDNWWIGIHGHVHRQHVFKLVDDCVILEHFGEGIVNIESDKKYIVCPGSVGVSRDFDPRTAYMIVDDEGTITMKRIDYDWKKSTNKIREAGLETQLFLRKHIYLKRQIRKRIGFLVRGIKSGIGQ